jgi:cytochrome c-type biogenesis protein CcmE
MNQHHRRKARQLLYVIVGISLSVWLFIDAVSEGLHLYITPSEVYNQGDKRIYLGGRVVSGSLQHVNSRYRFQIADDQRSVWAEYQGTLPSMFKEGRDTVVIGRMDNEVFIAQQVLAKHDEYYRIAEEKVDN